MAIWDLFKKKEKQQKKEEDEDDFRAGYGELSRRRKELNMARLESENQLHLLRLSRERLQLEREIMEIKESMSEDYDDMPDVSEDESTNQLIKMLLPALLGNKNNQVSPNPPIVVENTPLTNSTPQVNRSQPSDYVDFSEDQIAAIYGDLSASQKMFIKSLNDVEIGEMIKTKFPKISSNTVLKICEYVRSH